MSPVGKSSKSDLISQLKEVEGEAETASRQLDLAKRMTEKAFKAVDKIDVPGKRDTDKFYDLRNKWQAAEDFEWIKYVRLQGVYAKLNMIKKQIAETPDPVVNPFIKKAAKTNPIIAKLLAQGKIA